MHREGTGNATFPKRENIVCWRGPLDALFARFMETFASFVFKDPLRIIAGNNFENQLNWISLFHFQY